MSAEALLRGSAAAMAEAVRGGAVTATCRGVFVAVPAGHPAHHRWGA